MAGPRDGLPVSVNGVKFETDVESITWRTVPPTRQGSDQGAGPGEQSLSMENIWRRTRENWREGAGQDYADLIEESSALRFRSSDGINPWVPRSLRLLPTTENKWTSAATNLKMVSTRVGSTDYLVVINGGWIAYSSDPTASVPTFTIHTGYAGTMSDLTTDGQRHWACNGSDIMMGIAGTVPATVFSNFDAVMVGYANGRLLAGDATGLLVEVLADGSTVTIMDHPNSAFVWEGVASSPAGIYVWGSIGDTSELYVVTAIDATGSLDVPFVAAAWLQGERINDMCSYAGIMMIATTRGVRMARIQGGGFLAYGPVIDEPGNVQCLEPQGEFVWFGWTYTSAINGLGRISLERTTDPDGIVPAFATDIMARGTVSGDVLSVCTVGTRRYFAISGRGFYGETTTLENVGIIDLGWFTYGISEEKVLDSVTVWIDSMPTNGTVIADIFADDASGVLISMTMDTPGQLKETLAYTGVTNAERIRVQLRMYSFFGSANPVVRRVTLRSSPKAFVAQAITLPLYLSDEVQTTQGGKVGMKPYEEFLALEALLKARTRFTLGVGSWSASARLEALEVEKGGLGGGNGLEGWADLRKFMAGKWEATFTTQEESG